MFQPDTVFMMDLLFLIELLKGLSCRHKVRLLLKYFLPHRGRRNQNWLFVLRSRWAGRKWVRKHNGRYGGTHGHHVGITDTAHLWREQRIPCSALAASSFFLTITVGGFSYPCKHINVNYTRCAHCAACLCICFLSYCISV